MSFTPDMKKNIEQEELDFLIIQAKKNLMLLKEHQEKIIQELKKNHQAFWRSKDYLQSLKQMLGLLPKKRHKIDNRKK